MLGLKWGSWFGNWYKNSIFFQCVNPKQPTLHQPKIRIYQIRPAPYTQKKTPSACSKRVDRNTRRSTEIINRSYQPKLSTEFINRNHQAMSPNSVPTLTSQFHGRCIKKSLKKPLSKINAKKRSHYLKRRGWLKSCVFTLKKAHINSSDIYASPCFSSAAHVWASRKKCTQSWSTSCDNLNG